MEIIFLQGMIDEEELGNPIPQGMIDEGRAWRSSFYFIKKMILAEIS